MLMRHKHVAFAAKSDLAFYTQGGTAFVIRAFALRINPDYV